MVHVPRYEASVGGGSGEHNVLWRENRRVKRPGGSPYCSLYGTTYDLAGLAGVGTVVETTPLTSTYWTPTEYCDSYVALSKMAHPKADLL